MLEFWLDERGSLRLGLGFGVGAASSAPGITILDESGDAILDENGAHILEDS